MSPKKVKPVCTSCNHVVIVSDAVAERRHLFSSGQLSPLGPLYGASSPSLPGEGPQSWLFCPLISLDLLVVEGPRAPVPDSQAQSWAPHARDVIHVFADHFSFATTPLAVTLSSKASCGPSRNHLDAHKEALTLLHITSNWKWGSLRRLVRLKELPNKVDSHFHPCTSHAGLSDAVPSPFLVSPKGGPGLFSVSVRCPSMVLLSPTLLSRQLHMKQLVVLKRPFALPKGWSCSSHTILGDVDRRVLRHSEFPHCSRAFQPH